MRTVFLIGIILIIFLTGFSGDHKEPPCTCIYYETLKEQLEPQDVIASVKVIKIDTMKAIPSYWADNKDALKYFYESNSQILNLVLKTKRILKGKISTDTFSVLSLNDCPDLFEENKEYIIAAYYQHFCLPELVSDSIKCNTKSLLSTNICCGNAVYSKSTEDYYSQNIK
jgi:hypothetical protein